MQGWGEVTLVEADAVRTDRGDLVFTTSGVSTHIIGAGRWTTCVQRNLDADPQ